MPGTAARWKRRYAGRLTVPRRGGWRASEQCADFERALADPADPASTSAEIASELRRGVGYVRVTVALTVISTDVADALAVAWDDSGSAARDDLTGWEATAAAAEVQPEPPLTCASRHIERALARRSLGRLPARGVRGHPAVSSGRPGRACRRVPAR